MTPPSRGTLLPAILVWIVTAVVVTTPLWLILGVAGLGLGAVGPFGVLLFKPGDQVAGKILMATLLLVPTLVGAAMVARRWSRLGIKGRLLSVMTLSILWHGTSTGLWWLIVTAIH